MTIQDATAKVIRTGNGSATSFSFAPIVMQKATDILVVKTITATGVETTLTEGTGTSNYSVTLTASDYPSTGSIVFPASGADRLASSETVTIKRNPSITQDADLENQGGYYPDTVEDALDRGVMISMSQQEDIDRSLKGPITDTVSVEIPSQTARANQFLTFDGSGVPTVSAGTTSGVTVSTFMATVLDDTTAAAARTTLGAAATSALPSAASTTAAGIVELATTAETTTGSDALRAVTPDGLHDMTSLAGAAWFLDEDAMGTNSATKVASQQSIKAYVTTSVAAAPSGRVKIIDNDWSSGTPSSVTFEDADGMNWSTYSYFDIELSGYISASCRIICTMSQGGAYETGSTDYFGANTGSQYTNAFDNASPGIDMPNISNQIYKGSSQYNEMFHLKASLYPGLSDGTNIGGPYIHWSLAGSKTTSGNRAHANGTGALRNLDAALIDGIKFELNTGNMPNGSFKVWGIV
jgi:hypothetical protein